MSHSLLLNLIVSRIQLIREIIFFEEKKILHLMETSFSAMTATSSALPPCGGLPALRDPLAPERMMNARGQEIHVRFLKREGEK